MTVPASPPARPSLVQLRGGLLLGILCVSTASIWIRLLGGRSVPPLTVAGYRMLYAAVLLSPALLAARRRGARGAASAPVYGAAAFFLAVHFGSFTAALYSIPVARAVLLVSTQPVFVALAQWLVLREPPRRRTLAALATALLGVAWLCAGDPSGAGGRLAGDLLAIASAASFAGYVLLGRHLRHRVPVAGVAVPLFAGAGALLLGAAAVGGQPLLPRGLEVHALLLALALFPSVGGHAVFQWTLRYVSPTVVSIAFLGEVAGAGILAWLFFGEVPPRSSWPGGLLCLLGVAGVILERPVTRTSPR